MIQKPPLLIAHRGDALAFRENTMEGFESAFNHLADGVEMDVQLRAGRLRVIHDYLQPDDKSIPFLEDVLDAFADKGRLQLDIKAFNLGFLTMLKRVTGPFMERDLELITNIWPVIPGMRNEFPSTKIGVIYPPKEFEAWMSEDFICSKVIGLMSTMKGDIAHIFDPVLTANPDLVKACHDNGFKVHAHITSTNGDKELDAYRRLAKLGVDQCTLNTVQVIEKIKRDKDAP